MNFNYKLILIIVMVAFMAGCKESTAAQSETVHHTAGSSEVKAETPSRADSIRLNDRMMANIKLEEISEKKSPIFLAATGKVQLNEDQLARVVPPVEGKVIGLKVKLGDSVKKGEPLFSLNSREVASAISEHLESHKDLDLAEKNFNIAKDIFDRQKDLYEHQATALITLQQSENDLARAKNELAKAQARVTRTEETLRILGVPANDPDLKEELNSLISVNAPLNGIVLERQVTEGQYVQPGSSLIVIADYSSVWVLADVFERDLHLIERGQRAEVTTAAYPDRTFVAQVSRIGDQVDPSTRTVKVRFLVTNPGGRLKPEMFASIKIFIDEWRRSITVPNEAVITEGDRTFVFVELGEGEFIRKYVEVTPDAQGRSRVTGGLQPGDKIVSNGALLMTAQSS